VLIHAVYRGQSLIVTLLNLATTQHLALVDAGIDSSTGLEHRDPGRFRTERLALWHRIGDATLL
jgi:hypothetical protein